MIFHKKHGSDTFNKIDTLSAIYKTEINGENVLEAKFTSKVNKLDSLVFWVQESPYWGYWVEMIVRGAKEFRNGTEVYAEHSAYELKQQFVIDKRPNGDPESHLENILENTRWSVGDVELTYDISNTYYYTSAYDAIKTLTSSVKGEVRFSVQFDNNTIVGRTVDILRALGTDKNRVFTYTKDMLGITRTIQDKDIVTALIGRGKGEQVSDDGYGRRITLTDISKPDSPINQPYVEDLDALAMWGIFNEDGSKSHRFATIEFDDVEDLETLYILTKEALQDMNTPEVSYEVSVVAISEQGEGVQLGDPVYIIDNNFLGESLRLYGRVLRMEMDLLNPLNTNVTIGKLSTDMSTYYKDLDEQIEKFKSKSAIWDRANAFDSNNRLPGSYIDDVLQKWNDEANKSGGYTYTIEGQGTMSFNKPIDENPTEAIQIIGGTMRFANSKKPDGSWDWRTIANADGIMGNEILAHTITADQLRSDVGSSLDLSSNESVKLQARKFYTMEEVDAMLERGAMTRNFVNNSSVVLDLNEDYDLYDLDNEELKKHDGEMVTISFEAINLSPEISSETYQSMTELLQDESIIDDWEMTHEVRNPEVVFFAPHGGGIEPGTTELLRDIISKTDYSWYSFETNRPGDNYDLHVTSTRYDVKELIDMQKSAAFSVSIHGAKDLVEGTPRIDVGGRDEYFRDIVIDEFVKRGLPAVIARTEIGGRNTNNITNKNARGRGVQLEFSATMRKMSFKDNDWSVENRTNPENWTETMFDINDALIAATNRMVSDYRLGKVIDQAISLSGNRKVRIYVANLGTVTTLGHVDLSFPTYYNKFYRTHITVPLKLGTNTRIGFSSNGLYGSSAFHSQIQNVQLELGTKPNIWTPSYYDFTAKSVVSTINVSPEQIRIASDKISLEGHITANEGFEINRNGSMIATLGQIGGWTIGPTTLSSGSGNQNVWLGAGDYTTAIRAGGESISEAPFVVYKDGTIKASKGNIGNWIISDDGSLISSNNLPYQISLTPYGSDKKIRVNDGDGIERFSINGAGRMYAVDADVEGKITATLGTIGGWTIGPTTLSSGSGNQRVWLGGAEYSTAFSAGGENNTESPFVVYKDGTIKASKGSIGNWIISDDGSLISSTNLPYQISLTPYGSDTKIRVNDGNGITRFSINGAGRLYAEDADVSGKITATSGTMGGWDIAGYNIDTRNGSSRFYFASSGSSLTNYIYASDSAGTRKFSVSKEGLLYARDADIDGKITATSGEISGWSIGANFLQYRPNSANNNNRLYLNSTPSGAYRIAAYNASGTRVFSVSSGGLVYATGATIGGTVNATGGYFTGGTTGQFTAGYHNNGSFSGGSFGGTGNLTSGTLGATTFTSVTNGVSFAGSISGGHRYTGGYNTADIGTTGTPFRSIYYATALTKVSDIRLKDDFENVDNRFNDFVYSLPIGSYTLKGSDNPQLGINANLVDNLFPDEVTKYIINKDERGYYSANYEALVPMLVKVVQEQHHRLIDLEYEVEQLKKGG